MDLLLQYKQERKRGVMVLISFALYEHTSRKMTRQCISLTQGGTNSVLQGLEEGRDSYAGATACPCDSFWFPGHLVQVATQKAISDCCPVVAMMVNFASQNSQTLFYFAHPSVIPQLASWGSSGPLSRFRTCFQSKEGGWVCRGPNSREGWLASGWHYANQVCLLIFIMAGR